MRRVKWRMLLVIAAVAVVAWVMFKSPRAATAIKGTICGAYSLPQGADIHELGIDADRNRIILSYKMPDGGTGELVVPFDTIAATCSDPAIRGIVAAAQERNRQVIEWTCKFVADVKAGKVQLPPGTPYDREYAEQWYRKTCLGAK